MTHGEYYTRFQVGLTDVGKSCDHELQNVDDAFTIKGRSFKGLFCPKCEVTLEHPEDGFFEIAIGI